MKPLASIALFFLLPACGLSLDSNGIGYNLPPQEFAQDFGNQMGSFPTVDCSKDAMACTKVPNLPAGATSMCDRPSGRCVLTYDVEMFQQVNLSQDPAFPSSVANSSATSVVTVGAVHYWTPMNSLNVASPPINLYVGPQSAQRAGDPNVKLLATMPSMPAMRKTACGSGSPGTQDSHCDLPLNSDGENALAAFAKNFKTPFVIIVATTLTVHAGDAIPSGKIDMFVQPEVVFK